MLTEITITRKAIHPKSRGREVQILDRQYFVEAPGATAADLIGDVAARFEFAEGDVVRFVHPDLSGKSAVGCTVEALEMTRFYGFRPIADPTIWLK